MNLHQLHLQLLTSLQQEIRSLNKGIRSGEKWIADLTAGKKSAEVLKAGKSKKEVAAYAYGRLHGLRECKQELEKIIAQANTQHFLN